MSAPFTGVLAVIGRPTGDRRTLGTPADPFHRELPLPLCTMVGEAAGRIERVWIDGDLLRYSGVVRDDVAPDISQKLVVGNLDADMGELTESGVINGWRVVAATLGGYNTRAWPEVSMTVEQPEQEIDATNVPPPGDDTVTIGADELHDLRQEARKLRALEAAGVDNWGGYDHAMQILRGEDE